MRSKLARVGVVAVGLLALLGTMTPPAHAALIFGVVFVGQANLTGAGLGYPCTTDGPLPVNIDPFYLCVTSNGLPTGVNILPLPSSHPESIIPNPSLDFNNHNVHSFGVVSNTCVGGGASVLKLHGVDAGTCSFTNVSGTVDGHCGLSGGQASGQVTVTNTIGGLPQTFVFNVHFIGIASVLVLTGHVTNLNTGQNGKLVGLVEAIPPTAVLTPGQSCAALTANTFVIAGAAAGYTRSLTIP